MADQFSQTLSHEETFSQYRPYLFTIAYRMLGSVMDAEDMVQESFLRWQQTTQLAIQSPKAYLASITTRLCIDHLRAAQTQRQNYPGPWLPAPLLTEHVPASEDELTLSDSLSMAFLVLLESLSPVERAAFLLRDVFEYEYSEIAQIVDKSEANCRQLVRRAREHLAARRPRFQTNLAEQQRLTMEFAAACSEGDMDRLLHTLADDIIVWSDGGGKISAARNPIYGADRAGRYLLGLLGKAPAHYTARFAVVNGQPGFVAYLGERPFSVMTLEIGNGRIQSIRIVVNPDKLGHVPPLPA